MLRLLLGKLMGDTSIKEGLEMSPSEAAEFLRAGDGFILVDVREAWELGRATVGDGVVHIPLGELRHRLEELDADEDTVIGVLCHHGVRSLRAALMLHRAGLTGARSVAGGIARWYEEVDTSVGRY